MEFTIIQNSLSLKINYLYCVITCHSLSLEIHYQFHYITWNSLLFRIHYLLKFIIFIVLLLFIHYHLRSIINFIILLGIYFQSAFIIIEFLVTRNSLSITYIILYDILLLIQFQFELSLNITTRSFHGDDSLKLQKLCFNFGVVESWLNNLLRQD